MVWLLELSAARRAGVTACTCACGVQRLGEGCSVGARLPPPLVPVRCTPHSPPLPAPPRPGPATHARTQPTASKADLARAAAAKQVVQFQLHYWVGHHNTDYKRWFKASTPYEASHGAGGGRPGGSGAAGT